MRRFQANDIMSLVEAPSRYDLAESVGPDLQLAELLDLDGTDLKSLTLSYGTSQGDERLRVALAKLHDVDAEDVVVTVGGAHALFLAAFLLCESGDEAITTAPVFPVTRTGLEIVGANVRVLRSSFDEGYQLDLEAIETQLTPRTKLVSIASPQNPSGVAVRREALIELLAMMRRRSPDAFLLVDETYREASYGGTPVAPSAVSLDERVISIASLSKCHGAPGLRLGWAITRHEDLRRQLTLAKFNTVISCSTLDEALALRVLERRADILAMRQKRLAAGVALTEEWAHRNQNLVEWIRPDAGALSCARLRKDRFDDAAVARFFDGLARRETRVGCGPWFGEEQHVFRLGFGLLATDDLRIALERLEAALHEAALPVSAGSARKHE